ncbi:hypothetical protein [Piscibacillus salipiscarius]|uniref:Uncharacterized protein n=1 Tax=Piscibacillus salipiscarius TaxID=299480 RepID=A0ABW5Q5Z9_9BACI|nr:hypothetical protein [Piscibacillus salipiscarius]
MLKYNGFVDKFETRLGRGLCPKEKDFVNWVWKKHKGEVHVKK